MRFNKVLLCCTGSVATIKLSELVESLRASNVEVQVCLTENAAKFFSDKGSLDVTIYRDADEWAAWKGRGDPVLHIELAKWADILLIAPLDANTLAKLSNGICDNLVTCVFRAWRGEACTVVVAPAMNTAMWQHPITEPQIQTIRGWGVRVIDPISKTLMCGDTGVGAMATPSDIVATVLDILAKLNK